MPNKKFQNARYKSLPKNIHFGQSTRIDTKTLASFEILNYYKYLFDAQGFYRKSPKSELTLEIENNYVWCKHAERGFRFTKFLNFHC